MVSSEPPMDFPTLALRCVGSDVAGDENLWLNRSVRRPCCAGCGAACALCRQMPCPPWAFDLQRARPVLQDYAHPAVWHAPSLMKPCSFAKCADGDPAGPCAGLGHRAGAVGRARQGDMLLGRMDAATLPAICLWLWHHTLANSAAACPWRREEVARAGAAGGPTAVRQLAMAEWRCHALAALPEKALRQPAAPTWLSSPTTLWLRLANCGSRLLRTAMPGGMV